MGEFKNWAGNYTFRAKTIHRPGAVEEVQELVRRLPKVKALGTRHSFNEVADSEGDLLCTENLNNIVSVNPERGTVTVQGGARYGELAEYLHSHGYGLQNLASLPHISVAGSVATGTHGSGERLGCLSTAVRALTIVRSDGEIVDLSREKDPERFAGTVVAMGLLGVVVELELAIEPTYQVAQTLFLKLPFANAKANFDAIEASGTSVSLFTDWSSDTINQVWVKQRADAPKAPPETLFGATSATRNMHPIGELSAINCTDQMGVPGPWHERLPHFKLGFTPSSGEELQSEFLVPRARAVEALDAITKLADKISPLLLICEIRTVAADDLWLSPAYGRDSVAIHFTWKQLWPEVKALLPSIEAALSQFGARPHWGKLFTIGYEDLSSRYEKLHDFHRLAAEFDPSGKFRNPFSDARVFGERS